MTGFLSSVSFLASTPETGVDSIALTWALLGSLMAVGATGRGDRDGVDRRLRVTYVVDPSSDGTVNLRVVR